jgi:polysaccharide chain length determinant protein (PEP-CTERM system associated)
MSSIFTLMLPKIYQSKASILVESRENSPVTAIFKTGGMSIARFQILKKILKSRAKAEEIMKKLGLEQNIDGPGAYEKLVRTIQNGIKIILESRSKNVIAVSFIGNDPRMVMQVTKTLCGFFIEQEADLIIGKRNTSSIPVLQELIDYYERRVATARAVLAKFRLEHKGEMFVSQNANFNKIETIQLKLAETGVAIREEMEKKRILERQLAGNGEELPDFEFVQSELTPDEKRLNQLYAERDSLLVRYTGRHPEIIRVKNKIETLKGKIIAQYRTEGGNAYAEEAVNTQQLSLSPQYIKLRKILERTNQRLLGLQEKKEKLAKRIQKLNELVRLAPRHQQEFAALKRDSNVNNKIYQSLLAKIEKAQLAQEIGAMEKSHRFVILNPARLPLKPVAPSMSKNIIIATVIGLLLGTSLAVWAEINDHSLRDLADAKEFLGIPILSTIPTVGTIEETIRKRRINMLITVLGTFYGLFIIMLIIRELILVYAPGLLYLQTYKELFYQLSDTSKIF